MSKPILTLVFRDKRAANHSIERLFAALEPHFAEAFEVHKVVVPRQPSGLCALLANIRYARKRVRGIVHVTGDAQYLVPFLPRGRTVLTIHDCIYLMKLRGLKRLLYRFVWFVLPLRAAARVTAVSEQAKEQVSRELGVAACRLQVIENFLIPLDGTRKKSFDARCPVILQIGSHSRKNLGNLIKAVAGMDCELFIVGGLSEKSRDQLESQGVRYRNEFAVSEDRLREIYLESDLLFFASFHEGFGLPILEAQSLCLPVITSNCSGMPHVAGDGAVLVDPASPKEIRFAVETICSDTVKRDDLVRSGLRNIERFSVEKTARCYMDLYRQFAV